MPIRFTLLPDHLCVDAVLELPIVTDELRAYYMALRDDRRFNSAFDSLLVISGSTKGLVLEPAELRRLLGETPFDATARRAFVATEPVVFGILRMAELSSDGQVGRFAIFSTRAEALEWLGLPADLPPP